MSTTNAPTDPQTVSTEHDPDELFAEVGFEQLGLRDSVLKGVEAAGFTNPTMIQARLIPLILSGRDVLGQAKTGTGKTAAFGLPIYNMVERGVPFQALILAPTRELAIQITGELEELGRNTPIKAVAVYGGQRITEQLKKIKRNPEIIVATPGRVMDLLQRGHIHFNNIRMAILDEVDRMLDIGFREDIRKILGQCPKKRQTVFVSATISNEIERLARSYMHDPEKIVSVSGSLTVSLVDQHYLTVEPWDKRRLLAHLLTHESPALTLVFCRMKRTVDELTRYLTGKNINAMAIHGDMYQSRRNAVMKKLRAGELSALIASDLAARGLDVQSITHVVNYDLPEDPEVYVHRIGRTARVGHGGVAWSFVTQDQGKLLTEIEKLTNVEIPELEYPDFKPGPLPKHVTLEREVEQQRRTDTAKPNRMTAPVIKEVAKDRADPAKFPGGIVPSKAPPKRMQGRIRSRRGR